MLVLPLFGNGNNGTVILLCMGRIEDVITVQEEKIRMKQIKVLDKSFR